uniref:hypothetical protein n=1 Tax=Paludisphaera soli TaxID=2712865 RepID=UPI0013EC22B3
ADELDRLVALVGFHFDPLGVPYSWSRHVRTWSLTYPAWWIEAVLPICAAKAAEDRFTGEGFGGAILKRWARSGGPPANAVPVEIPAGVGPPVG